MPDWGEVLTTFLAEEAGGEELRLPPPRVAGYRVRQLLGAHGQGQVYLAEDERSGERVALKRWRVPSERAERELAALLALDHPGVVRVRAGVPDEELGLPCLVMDFVEGSSLAAGAPLEPSAVARLGAEVARALAHVHERGLVHRDLKPSNLLRRADGSVVVIDFGLVKARAPAASGLTGAEPLGTLPYMSPEQLGLIAAPVGPRSDLYGLGVTLYECLTGALPFETRGAYERRGRDVWSDPPAGAQVAGVPADLRRIVAGCLAFDPEQRPASARELAALLTQGAAPAEPKPGALVVLAVALLGALGLALLGLASASRADRQLVLQPGPLLGRDADLCGVELYANDNNGPRDYLRVGARPPATGQAGPFHALIAFDLAALPPDAELLEARLELYCSHPIYGAGPPRVDVHEVLACDDGRTPWVEGTGLLDRELDGVAWSGSFQGRRPSEGSARPELSAPPYAPTPLARLAPRLSPAWVSADVTPAARRWLRAPAQNHGLTLRPARPALGAWCFASSDHIDPALRPRLRLRFRGSPARPRDERALAAAGRREAQAALDYAHTLARRANPRAALAALSSACRAAPDWGRPYFERAGLADQLGLQAVAWIDAERCLATLDPELTPAAFLRFASGWTRREGDGAQLFGLAAALIAATDPDAAAEADALLARALPPLSERLPSAASRDLLDKCLARHAEAGLLPGPARARSSGPALALVLWRLARGERAAARRAASQALARWPEEPRLRALAELEPSQAARPALRAAWVRALLLAGEGERARSALSAARSEWPQDAGLARLDVLFTLRDRIGSGRGHGTQALLRPGSAGGAHQLGRLVLPARLLSAHPDRGSAGEHPGVGLHLLVGGLTDAPPDRLRGGRAAQVFLPGPQRVHRLGRLGDDA